MNRNAQKSYAKTALELFVFTEGIKQERLRVLDLVANTADADTGRCT
jgi:hypothetical protein